jgi:hypothetical protein
MRGGAASVGFTETDNPVGAARTLVVEDCNGDGLSDAIFFTENGELVAMERSTGGFTAYSKQLSGSPITAVRTPPIGTGSLVVAYGGSQSLDVLQATGGCKYTTKGSPMVKNANVVDMAPLLRGGKWGVAVLQQPKWLEIVLPEGGSSPMTIDLPQAFGSPVAVAAGALNADNEDELVVIDSPAAKMYVREGKSGDWSPAVDLLKGPIDVALVDMTCDGNLDAVVVTSTDQRGTVSVFPGTGMGTISNSSVQADFDPGPTTPKKLRPSAMTTVDLDGDGDQDVVVVGTNNNGPGGWYRVLINQGAGVLTLSESADLQSDFNEQLLAVARGRFNDDAADDVVAARGSKLQLLTTVRK